MRYEFKTKTFSVIHEPVKTQGLVSSPDDVVPFLKGVFQDCDADKEHFAVIFLDVRNNITGYKIVSIGTISSCLVHPREVFRPAIEASASSIIVAHTHPSQDVKPSNEDTEITERLAHSGRLLGIPLLDHVIMASGITPTSAWNAFGGQILATIK